MNIFQPNIYNLLKIDERTYNYLHQQIRYDLFNCLIKDFDYQTQKNNILGMCTMDM
jgi:hypothetical protein